MRKHPSAQPMFRCMDVTSYWPRKLLHIPDMRSMERREGNMYGITKEPHYGILTYTWGRWERENGERLRVIGTPWKIPAVSEAHSTVRNFENVIREIGREFEFVWVDIACIDQEDDAIKMDEIGRQVGIFSNAKHVYVWLSCFKAKILQTLLDEMFTSEVTVQHSIHEYSLQIKTDLLDRLYKSMSELLSDPWFSSLWTLQEGTLRRDALLLSQEGHAVTMPHSRVSKVHHGMVLNSFWNICNALREPFGEHELATESIRKGIIQIIDQAGYSHTPFARNPNIQYAAAQYRKTLRPLDRIYAIMAIYDVQLNRSTGPDITFGQLVYEFALALNVTSPRLGQMFIHTHKPQRGCSWMITQRCRILDGLGDYQKLGDDACVFSASEHPTVIFEGQTCCFEDLFSVWGMGEFALQIFLDDHIFEEHKSLHRALKTPSSSSSENTWNSLVLARDLLEAFRQASLKMLSLGEQFLSGLGGDGHRLTTGKHKWGLLLLQDKSNPNEFTRIGVSSWDSEADQQPIVLSSSSVSMLKTKIDWRYEVGNLL